MRIQYVMLLVVMPLPAFAFSVDDIIEQNTRHSWHLGKGLSPGDSLEYLVCDNTFHKIESPDGCYHVRMDFYLELESRNRSVWIVQAEITAESDTRHVFLINSDTLEIETDRTAGAFAKSIQNTVFYLSEFTHPQLPQRLQIGQVWGNVPSTINIGSDLVVIAEDTVHEETTNPIDVFVIRYGLFESSVFTVSPDLPFPVSAVAHDPLYITSDPPVIFTFDLLDYSTGDMAHNPSNGTETVLPRG